ncbi:unnamed protein product [Bursaphelenchus xylophilus]|uniref:(pine wood nematode) hypothetical protein n=1 Tax=Bursaphelenchus xylophilus TaxID=6326 RepID=A0A1I7RUZ3_BURXY|nr:unnamed protein product [Bursaphelenchus xylophilus]CAG9105276.1 unnamed protein product [Bursaphelenchus xylophilus]
MKLFVLSLLCIVLALSGAQRRTRRTPTPRPRNTTILSPRTADAVGGQAERLFNQQYQQPPFQRYYKRVTVHNATHKGPLSPYWIKMTMEPTMCRKDVETCALPVLNDSYIFVEASLMGSLRRRLHGQVYITYGPFQPITDVPGITVDN